MFLPQVVLVVSPGSPVAAPNECDGGGRRKYPCVPLPAALPLECDGGTKYLVVPCLLAWSCVDMVWRCGGGVEV